MATFNGNNSGDTYPGTSDPDLIYGGRGNDALSGSAGNDSIYGGEDRDTLYGEADQDLLDGGTQADSLFGGAGNDSLYGGDDSDTLYGDDGNDLLDGGNGNDSLFGGAGADRFVLNGTFGNDTLSGGETDSATDTVDASGLTSGVTVSVTSAEAGTIFITGSSANTASFTGMESFTLTASADTFSALNAGSAVVVDGGAGTDRISGSAVNDTLSGGLGADTIAAGGGNDTVYDEFQGNTGAGSADTVDLGSGNDIYIGSGTGAADKDLIYGGIGNDTITTAGGIDTVYGGDGDDVITAGNDTLASNGDLLSGDAGNDTILGGNTNDTLLGGTGADSMQGNGGNDLMYGGSNAGIGVNLISNGDFSSGSTGWSGTDLETTFTEGAYLPNGSTNAVAETDGNTGQTTVMQQSFTVSGTATANVAFRSVLRNDASAQAGTDGFRVEVVDSSGTVISTVDVFPPTGTWTSYSIPVTFPSAGTYTLRFTELGNNDSLGAIVDDIQVISTTVAVDTSGDTLDGGDGNDSIHGEGGNDSLSGGAGQDSLYGGADNDTLAGDAGNDLLQGGAGTDSLAGGADNDTLQGDAGNDRLDGGAGNDNLTGGDGDDTFLLADGFGSDVIDGNEAAEVSGDTLDMSGLTLGVNVTLTGAEAGTVLQGANSASFTNIERLVLTGGNDSVDGTAVTTGLTLDGLAGNDTLRGGSGADALTGGTGNDSLSGGAGQDSLYGGADNDTLAGDAGNDLLQGGAGNDSLEGGADNDTLDGGDNNDTLAGGAGADSLIGGSGTDTATYAASGSGVNVTLGGTGSGGDAQGDTLSGVENLTGSDHDDSLTGDGGDNQIDAGNGNDLIASGSGVDLVFGGSGNDTIGGGDGNDTLDGGTGDDSLSGGDGLDTIYGGDGRDTLVGGNIGDFVDGGEGGDDVDTLDLTGAGPLRIIRDPLYPDNKEMGIVQFLDPTDRHVVGEMNFRNIENVIPCFTPGTLILTARGQVAIEDLAVGDLIVTRDHGLQPLRWVGQRDLSLADLIVQPQLQPVRIAAGALGPGLPARNLLVSPQHRMLLEGARAELLFGDAEVLVAATHLTSLAEVNPVLARGVRYIHLLFDTHELIEAEGAWTESFQPAARTYGAMDAAQRAEIAALFPEIAHGIDYPAARQTLKAHEARVLLAA